MPLSRDTGLFDKQAISIPTEQEGLAAG